MKWLKHFNVTDVDGIQIFSFSIPQSLSQIVNFRIRFLNKAVDYSSLFLGPLLPLLSFIGASQTLPLVNSDQVVVSIYISF